MNARHILTCPALALAFLVLASACSFLDSGTDLPPVSSFHYVQTATSTRDGKTTEARFEGFYRAPDSVRMVSESRLPFLEVIVIGPQAWIHASSGWYRMGADSVRAMAFANSYAILGWRSTKGLEDIGSGPITAGEPTRRYRAVNENAGDRITEAQERIARSSQECAELFAPVKDAFKDLTATLEIVVGERTKHVYLVITEIAGSDVSSQTQIVVDQYDEPVQIEPPAGAQDHPERTGVPSPCS